MTTAGHTSLPRKLIHLAMTVIPAIGWLVSWPLAVVLSALFLLASVLIEALRRRQPTINRLLWRLLPTTFRPWEERRVLGSTWFALGMFLTLLLWGRDVGGTAVLFLIWGDPAAEIIGRRWGRSPGGGKTWAGSLGCFIACLLMGPVGVGLGGLHPIAVLGGALTATLVERRSPPPDDNVWIPILSGAVMALGRWLLS